MAAASLAITTAPSDDIDALFSLSPGFLLSCSPSQATSSVRASGLNRSKKRKARKRDGKRDRKRAASVKLFSIFTERKRKNEKEEKNSRLLSLLRGLSRNPFASHFLYFFFPFCLADGFQLTHREFFFFGGGRERQKRNKNQNREREFRRKTEARKVRFLLFLPSLLLFSSSLLLPFLTRPSRECTPSCTSSGTRRSRPEPGAATRRRPAGTPRRRRPPSRARRRSRTTRAWRRARGRPCGGGGEGSRRRARRRRKGPRGRRRGCCDWWWVGEREGQRRGEKGGGRERRSTSIFSIPSIFNHSPVELVQVHHRGALASLLASAATALVLAAQEEEGRDGQADGEQRGRHFLFSSLLDSIATDYDDDGVSLFLSLPLLPLFFRGCSVRLRATGKVRSSR